MTNSNLDNIDFMPSQKNSTNLTKLSLDNFSARDKKHLKEIGKKFIIDLYANGSLTDADLSQPYEIFFEKIKSISDRSIIDIVTDHRDRILNEAIYFYEKKEYALAKIMYAMFFEHSINGIISNYCVKIKLGEKIQIDIIKSIDIHGKLTWLLKILEFPLFNESHKKTIKKVAEDRNAFIHYKWKIEDIEDKYSSYSDEFKKIKQATIYMKNYESRILFNRNKIKLESKLKKR
jgi:hypothetical protein